MGSACVSPGSILRVEEIWAVNDLFDTGSYNIMGLKNGVKSGEHTDRHGICRRSDEREGSDR